jgi:hypothetical protein
MMDMTFEIKVRGMDGDDGPCHAASFGIPAYMIAYRLHWPGPQPNPSCPSGEMPFCLHGKSRPLPRKY